MLCVISYLVLFVDFITSCFLCDEEGKMILTTGIRTRSNSSGSNDGNNNGRGTCTDQC